MPTVQTDALCTPSQGEWISCAWKAPACQSRASSSRYILSLFCSTKGRPWRGRMGSWKPPSGSCGPPLGKRRPSARRRKSASQTWRDLRSRRRGGWSDWLPTLQSRCRQFWHKTTTRRDIPTKEICQSSGGSQIGGVCSLQRHVWERAVTKSAAAGIALAPLLDLLHDWGDTW